MRARHVLSLLFLLMVFPVVSAQWIDFFDDATFTSSDYWTRNTSGFGTGNITVDPPDIYDDFIIPIYQGNNTKLEYLDGENVSATIQCNAGGGEFCGVGVKANNGTNSAKNIDGYLCVMRQSSGKLEFLNAGIAWVSSSAKSITNNAPYNYKAQYNGTHMKCKAWPANTAEPASWDIDTAYAVAPRNGVGEENGVMVAVENIPIGYVTSFNYTGYISPTASNFTVTAKNLWNNASITTFNATINGTDYNTTTGSIVTPYLDNESVLVNITVTAESFFDNTTLNVNTSSDFEAGLYKYTEIYVRDIINDSSIPNFTVYYESIDDSSDNGTETTTSGTAYLPLFNATYNLTIQSANIGTQYYSTDSDTEAANLYLRNHTFYLFRSNTANITFYHERSLDLADDINISASLIVEGVWANNYTTGNGTLFLENLNAGNYEIRYDSTGYPERSYFFTLSNNTYTQISLYIANGTHTTEVTNTLYDELGNKLSEYYIRLLRYYVGTNSYLLVDECRTNFGGTCVLNAELSSETQSVYYKFRIVGPDGTVYKTTQSTRIYETSLTHFISLSSSIIDELQELNTISYDVDFLTATNQFKYTWDDSAGTLSSATLSVYQLTSNGTEILNSTTTTASSSGTIYIAVTDDNTTTYIAKAFAGSNFVQSVDHSFFNTVEIFGRFGIFLTMIIVIAIVSLGIWQPAVAAILVPVALLITKVAGLNPLPYAMISAIGGVALIIIFAMSRIR